MLCDVIDAVHPDFTSNRLFIGLPARNASVKRVSRTRQCDKYLLRIEFQHFIFGLGLNRSFAVFYTRGRVFDEEE